MQNQLQENNQEKINIQNTNSSLNNSQVIFQNTLNSPVAIETKRNTISNKY